MTISQALMVRVGTYRFAVLTRNIDRVVRARADEIVNVSGHRYLQVGEESYPIINLAERIGEPSMSTAETYTSLIMVRLADRMAVFEVDQFEETLEIVTKSAGRQLTSIPGVTGVTVLADTSIALVINPGELAGQVQEIPMINPTPGTADSRGDDAISSAVHQVDTSSILETVLAVDDSLVVRKVMQRDLEGIGLQVLTAVDGQDALEVLNEHQADVALVDLEMPRMNGYELLTRIRSDERFARMPVVIITSRAGEMHRERAMSLGADGYITKPYDISELEALMKSLAA